MFARTTHPADGVTNVFSVPFPYISKDHVQVSVADALKASGADYSWINSSTISFTSAPATGTIKIQRVTPASTADVTFQDASILVESDLNLQTTQLLYLQQENQDYIEESNASIVAASTSAAAAALQASQAATAAAAAQQAADTTQASVAPAVAAAQQASSDAASAAQLADQAQAQAAATATAKLSKASNLSDVVDAVAARSNLGIDPAIASWVNGDGTKPASLQSVALSEVFGGTSAKHFGLARGNGNTYDTSDVPPIRSQWFMNVVRAPSIPWVAHSHIQTIVGSSNTEKTASQVIEHFHQKPGSSEGIAQILMATAMGDRFVDPTNSGGDLWGSWVRVSNHKYGGGAWLAHGIAQELNCRNVYPSDLRTRAQMTAAGVASSVVSFEDWQDTPDIIAGGYPTHLMYCLQVFPDYSSRHLTRGISFQPTKDAGAINPNTGLAEKIPYWVGFHTGIMLTGYVDTGIFIDSQIEKVNVGYSWEANANTIAANPIGIKFGYNTQVKMAFQRKTAGVITNDWLLNREGGYLLWRRDGSNWFQAFDADTNRTLFQNAMFSMSNAGRLNVGGTTDVTGATGVGISILGDNLYPLVMQKSTGAAVAPGAGKLVLRVQAGSTAGTLMIAAYAGTSNTGKIVADNIGLGN